jgi:hypothetical protein
MAGNNMNNNQTAYIRPIKEELISFIKNAYNALAKDKAKLIDQINRNDITGSFGQSNIDALKRSESLVHVLDFSLDYIGTDEFKKLTEAQIREWLEDTLESLKNRETSIFITGICEYCRFLEPFFA